MAAVATFLRRTPKAALQSYFEQEDFLLDPPVNWAAPEPEIIKPLLRGLTDGAVINRLNGFGIMAGGILLLVVFAASLAFPPTAVERIARLSEPDLPPSGVAYTRRVTQVWCGFFVLNGALALATALWMSDRAWALYNGLIAYGLIGLLFGVEWLVRQRVRAGHRHG